MEEDQMNTLLRNIASDYKTQLPQLFSDRQRPTIDKKVRRLDWVLFTLQPY